MCGDAYRRQQEVDGYIECIKLPQRSTNLAAKNGAGLISNALHKCNCVAYRGWQPGTNLAMVKSLSFGMLMIGPMAS